MEYKLIAVDMDGTLLTSDNTISNVTELAVKSAIEQGVIFTLSTGRPLQGVKKYIQQLGLDCYIITYNGAVVVHSTNEDILFSQNMDQAEAKRVWKLAQKYKPTVCIWSKNKLYVNEISEKTDFYEGITNTKAVLVDDFETLAEEGITKILWYADPEILNQWILELHEERFMETTFAKSRAYFLEFFSNKTSKAVAMEKLGEHYGISKEEMIAIGDQTNDLPMIQYAGLGVAMENAVDQVKSAADHITLSNNDDGVAKVIEKFILKK